MLKAVRSLRKARYNPPSFSLSLSVPLSLCEATPPPYLGRLRSARPWLEGADGPPTIAATRDAAPQHALSCHAAALSHCGRGPENLPAGCCGG